MSNIDVYGGDTDFFETYFIAIGLVKAQDVTSTQFMLQNTAIGSAAYEYFFIGNYTTSSGGISGGTITELDIKSSSGILEAVITGVNVPLSSGSFSSGAFFAPGSTYQDKSGNSALIGNGNDSYIATGQTRIEPGGGLNTISSDSTGVWVLFSGALKDYTLSAGSGGSVTVTDSNLSRNGFNIVTGSITFKFEGDQTFVTDNQGQLALTASASSAASYASSALSLKIGVSDTAANIATNMDSLQTLAAAGELTSIAITDGGTLSLAATQFTRDSGAIGDISGSYQLAVTGLSVASALSAPAYVSSVGISDSAAHVIASLDTLETLAGSGKLGVIALTNSGIPVVTVTPDQSVKDAGALKAIAGTWTLDVTAGTSSQTIDGVGGEGALIHFSGNASQYNITADGLGGVLVASSAATDHVHNATALQFGDFTDFVASETPATPNGISSFQVATLYAAVLARTPDVPGLAYYENMAMTSPAIPITTYAQYFLQSPEYTTNLAHNYAQSASGDAQFITDTYSNLLHRAPAAGDVAWYQANVINPGLASAAPGTSAYGTAELQAHAAVLADFSQSAEFKGDVQVTAQAPSSAQHWLILA